RLDHRDDNRGNGRGARRPAGRRAAMKSVTRTALHAAVGFCALLPAPLLAQQVAGTDVVTINSLEPAQGVRTVNAASGVNNQQANLAVLATGFEGLLMTDAILGQTRASTKPPGATDGAASAPDRSVALGDGAFADGSRLVQVSLVGGDRNSSANSFALSVVAG